MEFKEFGSRQKPKLMLIHGAATDWELCFGSFIEELSKDFLLVIPILTGHNPNEKTKFSTIEEEAKSIEKYITEHYDGKINMAYGLSMGGSILIQIIANNKIHVDKAILDAAPGAPLGLFSEISSNFLTSQIVNVQHKELLNPIMQFLFETNDSLSDMINSSISEENIRKCILECHHYKIPASISSTTTKVNFWLGSKEPFAFKSAKNLKKFLPNMPIKIFKKLGHGELLARHPDRWLLELKQVIK